MSIDLSHNLNDELPDGKPVKRFYVLQDLFLSYFHPDWMLDDPSPDVVILRFAEQDRTAVDDVIDEIDEMIALDVSDETLRAHVLDRYDCNYDPFNDGLTMRQWLEHAQTLLRHRT